MEVQEPNEPSNANSNELETQLDVITKGVQSLRKTLSAKEWIYQVIIAEKDLQLAKKHKTIDKHKNKTHNQTAQIELLREYETRKIR